MDEKQHQEVSHLKQLIKEENAEILITGMAMDLKSLRPEILSLCIVHDSSWFESNEKYMELSKNEYVTKDIRNALYDVNDSRLFEEDFAPENCISVGAACLQVGIPIAQQRIRLKPK